MTRVVALDGGPEGEEATSVRPGHALPRLTLVRRLSARVWLAEHTDLGCEVVVKIADGSGDGALFEAAVAALPVAGPHLVRIVESGRDGDTSWLVSELAPGEPLSARVARQGRLSLAAITAVARQLGWALARLHGAGLAHGQVDAEHAMVVDAPAGLRVRLVGTPKRSDEAGQADDRLALAETLFAAADDDARSWLSGWHARATSPRKEARHPSALELVDAMAEPDLASAASRAGAGTETDADAAFATARRLLATDDAETAARVLEAALPAILDGERTRELEALLGGTASPALDELRLVALAEEGDAERLGTALPPSSTTPGARFAWAGVQRLRGRLDEALAEIPSPAETPARLRFEVGLFRARCLADRGAVEQAIEVLATLASETPGEIAGRDALLANLLSRHDAARAHRLASSARRSLAAARPHERRRAATMLVHALYVLGRRREALEIHDAVPAPRSGRARRLFGLIHACCLYDAGEIDRVAEAVARLLAEDDPALSPYLGYLQAGVHEVRGEVDALFGLLPRLRGHATPGSDLDTWLAGLAARTRQRRRLPPGPFEHDPDALVEVGRLFEATVAARWGKLPDAARAALLRTDGSPEIRLHRALARTTTALADGDAPAALREAVHAVAEARAHGYALVELDARVAVCEALAISSEREALAEAARELGQLATRVGAPMHRGLAECFAAAASGRADGLARLERIAAAPDAPDASLLAKAALGTDTPRDPVDHRVLAALAAWLPRTTAEPAGGASDVGWGLDERTSEAWLPSGARVSFRDTPILWRLLTTLADRGPTSKEDLVRAVWRERAYHPFRHDNRLQAAVRKLRRRLDDDHHQLVETTEGGYALGGRVRRAR